MSQIQIVKSREPCGEIIYTVSRDGQKIATVCRGWLRLGGEQWVATMADRAAFGERTLRDMWRRIERTGGAA